MSRKPRVQRTPEEKWQIVFEGLNVDRVVVPAQQAIGSKAGDVFPGKTQAEPTRPRIAA